MEENGSPVRNMSSAAATVGARARVRGNSPSPGVTDEALELKATEITAALPAEPARSLAVLAQRVAADRTRQLS
jgi:hypothetical protein